MARKGTYWTRPGQSAATQGGRSGKAGRADTGTAGDRRSRAAAPRPGHRDAGAATGPRRRTRRVGAARADRAVVTRRRAFSHRDALQRVFMEVCLSSFPSRFPSWVAGPGPANYGVWRWRGDETATDRRGPQPAAASSGRPAVGRHAPAAVAGPACAAAAAS